MLYRFDGRVVAFLPFQPISLVQNLTHRNLPGEDYTECSFIFLYILSTMSIRQVNYFQYTISILNLRHLKLFMNIFRTFKSYQDLLPPESQLNKVVVYLDQMLQDSNLNNILGENNCLKINLFFKFLKNLINLHQMYKIFVNIIKKLSI